jgi:hypothetical protein
LNFQILSTETLPVEQNLKKIIDLLPPKKPEELEKFGLLELEKLYSYATFAYIEFILLTFNFPT